MSASIVEIIRQLHQDIEEQLTKSIDELSRELKRHRENLHRNHTVAQRIKIVADNIQRLRELYKDQSGILQREIKSISGNNEQAYHNFMRQCEEITRKYAERPELNITNEESDHALSTVPDIDTILTPGELSGRAIDLQYYHHNYASLSIVKSKVNALARTAPHNKEASHARLYTQISYTSFLQHFDDLPLLLDLQLKRQVPLAELQQYNEWLVELANYMQLYFYKVYPLAQFDDIIHEIKAEFVDLYTTNRLLGYTVFSQVKNHRQPKDYGISNDLYSTYDSRIDPSAQPPQQLQYDTIKTESHPVKADPTPSNETREVDAQEGNPLYCKPCDKVFAKDTVFNAHLTGQKHKRLLSRYTASMGQQSDNADTPLQPSTGGHENIKAQDIQQQATQVMGREQLIRTIAQHEFIISVFSDLLRSIITFSVDVAERKASTTLSELYIDLNISDDEEDQDDIRSTSTGENNTFTTVGGQRQFIVDGRPIPIWLYKLHGLNIKYTCEVCGGDTFLGERNYKLHFKNWKHTYMLKCLNIVNSKEYVDVSRIQDVLDLQAKLAAQNELPTTQMIEVEDVLGNIYERPATR